MAVREEGAAMKKGKERHRSDIEYEEQVSMPIFAAWAVSQIRSGRRSMTIQIAAPTTAFFLRKRGLGGSRNLMSRLSSLNRFDSSHNRTSVNSPLPTAIALQLV